MNYTQYCNSPCTICHKLIYFNEQIWLPSLYTPANDKMLGFFQGVGDSSQGFANFILYCALTDKVRERVFAAIFLRKPIHHSTGDNSRRLRASTVETQPSSHEVTRTEEVVNWPTIYIIKNTCTTIPIKFKTLYSLVMYAHVLIKLKKQLKTNK